ncbi:MAG: DNA-directed RNA polymerase subunit N [Candidatus Micrarchaeota archaeon]|nr:DNA-directed RNA polymerase subunit N [Candidatus Micrarchaeota archaeon]
MEFPVRCYTCGAVIGDLYDQYKSLSKDKNPEQALNDLLVDRYCCRRMFLGHVEVMGTISKYPRI